MSLAYTERLKEAKLLASTGSTGDSYGNAMAESINGLYKAEVIRQRLARTVLIFTERSDQLSRATDRVPGLPASPEYAQ